MHQRLGGRTGVRETRREKYNKFISIHQNHIRPLFYQSMREYNRARRIGRTIYTVRMVAEHGHQTTTKMIPQKWQ